MSEVNKERARVWVAALRSKKFKQGSGNLEKRGKFCCLGVLCWTLEDEGEITSTYYPDSQVRTWDGASILPSDKVAHLMKLEDANIEVTYQGERMELWRLNDVEKLSFDQIADLIEKEFDL